MTELIKLPPPDLVGGRSLTETLADRRSVRDFHRTTLSWEALSQLLWATQGVTSDRGDRTAPSAGALFPLELYVVTNLGVLYYDPHTHTLEIRSDTDVRKELSVAALSQAVVEKAPAVFVLTAVYSRTEQKYHARAERYVKLEVGHAGQNLALQAVALDLGSVQIGAFDDDRVTEVLDLPSDHEPLYLIPVGRPVG